MSKLGGVFIAVLFACTSAQAQNPTASVAVDADANRRAINPNVYGLAYATTKQLTDLNVPLNRYGGNNTTRYNWQITATIARPPCRGAVWVGPRYSGSRYYRGDRGRR